MTDPRPDDAHPTVEPDEFVDPDEFDDFDEVDSTEVDSAKGAPE